MKKGMMIGLVMPTFRDDYASRNRAYGNQNKGAGQDSVTHGGGVPMGAPVRPIIAIETGGKPEVRRKK